MIEAIEALQEALKTCDGTSITYRRGASSVTVTATKGRTEFELQDDNGYREKIEAQDWLIDVADLKFSGTPVEPQAGDKIEEADGGKTYHYAVMDGTPFRYSDHYRSRFRIHSKQVKVV